MASEIPEKKEEQHSTSELFSSAKLVAEAAQANFRGEADKVDKAKAADAAGDLLDAAGQYGKLDDQKGIGQYVDKAADYLHNYQSKEAAAPSSEPPKEAEGEAPKSGGGGGGLGDFAKLAGGFLK
ncbi:hypothetical protein HN51_013785 [Arachis hypogaea]|uniref:nodulin-related protein 1 n=1 Tax=Arachis ipaensis TaxID=130454 RepID=UPI0007AF4E74|nr:nodulin-related protein 1 [Arachis ipaensis]XP_025639136.1 nodulin-related protein 1 [Arachis hypogaea]